MYLTVSLRSQSGPGDQWLTWSRCRWDKTLNQHLTASECRVTGCWSHHGHWWWHLGRYLLYTALCIHTMIIVSTRMTSHDTIMFSVYRGTPGYTSNVYIKTAVWYHFSSLVQFWSVFVFAFNFLMCMCVCVCVHFDVACLVCLTFHTVYIVFYCAASWRNKEWWWYTHRNFYNHPHTFSH